MSDYDSGYIFPADLHDAMQTLHELYNSAVLAGFSEVQAMQIIISILPKGPTNERQ